MAKKKMSIETKTKLVYSIELSIIAVIFIVVATLELVGVIHFREWALIGFNWLTLFGGLWMIADFVWTLVSEKKRKKNSSF